MLFKIIHQCPGKHYKEYWLIDINIILNLVPHCNIPLSAWFSIKPIHQNKFSLYPLVIIHKSKVRIEVYMILVSESISNILQYISCMLGHFKITATRRF